MGKKMIARQAKEIVRQWALEEAARTPGFRGAFFHGSINWLPDEAELPQTSDVDVLIVLDRPAPLEKPGKLLYRAVVIDASYLPAAQIRSAEQALGLSHLAGSLRSGNLIADPTGELRAIQAQVSTDYAKQEWVVRRCEHALDKVRRHLQGLDEAKLFHDQALAWLFGAGVTTHVLLAAGLKNTTVRKRYLAVRELLMEYDRADFYETLLEMLGCAWITQAQAERHLCFLAAAFDAARMVIRSPFSFAADISDLARPLVIDGSRELIERGDHREALFWMAVSYLRCQKVLLQDGPVEIFERHDLGCRALLADLGVRSSFDLKQRSRQLLQMLPEVWVVAETIIASNPEIIPAA